MSGSPPLGKINEDRRIFESHQYKLKFFLLIMINDILLSLFHIRKCDYIIYI